MAFRDLTLVYLTMRANSLNTRNIFNDNQFTDDKTALVLDLDNGNVKTVSKLPPEWISDVNEVEYDMEKIKKKLKDLNNMHDKHLNRPTLDDDVDEEKKIDFLTTEITQMLSQSQNNIRKISIRTNSNSTKLQPGDQRLMKNVVSKLATSLQELTITFRKNQNLYLQKIKSRKERSNMLFDTSEYSSSSAFLAEDNSYDDDFDFKRSRQEQLQSNRISSKLLGEREVEINNIVKSINDLNELFKDLATMVVDQGTVLDRIDCNIERVSHSVEGGLVQLQKAAKYQKASRKMYIITVLMIIFIVLFFLLVVTKF